MARRRSHLCACLLALAATACGTHTQGEPCAAYFNSSFSECWLGLTCATPGSGGCWLDSAGNNPSNPNVVSAHNLCMKSCSSNSDCPSSQSCTSPVTECGAGLLGSDDYAVQVCDGCLDSHAACGAAASCCSRECLNGECL